MPGSDYPGNVIDIFKCQWKSVTTHSEGTMLQYYSLERRVRAWVQHENMILFSNIYLVKDTHPVAC
jgi:hypothetical protein